MFTDNVYNVKTIEIKETFKKTLKIPKLFPRAYHKH